MAAPHLPCPHVDRKLLLRMAEYAMRVNFTSPRAKPIEPKFDVSAALEPLIEATSSAAALPADGVRVGVRVTGHGGGDWSLVVRGEEIVSVDVGIHPGCGCLAECQVDIFAALARGHLMVEAAVARGDLMLTGDMVARGALAVIFRQIGESGRARAHAAPGEVRALAAK
jgi:hypothetical protein